MLLTGSLTPVSDSSAITPPCSPPCDVIEDVEEGELQDEDNMSDIRLVDSIGCLHNCGMIPTFTECPSKIVF